MIIERASILHLLNQIFEITQKIKGKESEKSLTRNLKRMTMVCEEAGYFYHVPLGESYDLTRLDCEATIAGDQMDKLIIVEVIKPIIYYRMEDLNEIVQKAVVIVEQS